MKRPLFFAILLIMIFPVLSNGQSVILEGYVFEDDNRGYLNEVQVKVIDQVTESVIIEAYTNTEGFFSCEVPAGKDLLIRATKNLFFPAELIESTHGLAAGKKLFPKIKLKRRPGYLLELTLAETRVKADSAISITDTHIEVYNNTTREQELDMPIYPSPEFKYTLQRGNHYTFLIRKEGYFNKRIEAFVDVKGCIVCIDGVQDIGPGPGVSDNLTEGFAMGTLLANLELEKASLDKVIALENIYYDSNSSDIRADAALELEKVITLLKDNPVLLIELGSHTDSRGQKRDNRKLSQARADAAVEYIAKHGGIAYERLSAKGYGESQLVNHCADDVECEDKEHQANRRTELRIIGYADSDPIERLSLGDIIRQEQEQALLEEVLRGEVVSVPSRASDPPQKALVANTTPKGLKVSETAASAGEESDNSPAKAAVTAIPVSEQEFMSIDSSYEGYRIEILSTAEYLSMDHKLFEQYKNIYLEKRSETEYSYLIGHFKNQSDAQLYVDALLSNEYPQAKVIQYIGGTRR
ncbi:MAG: OmpA family protein [Saprospiraceae bacterium]|nr:OmpA family protein [Saprospiraceae bacterium]